MTRRRQSVHRLQLRLPADTLFHTAGEAAQPEDDRNTGRLVNVKFGATPCFL